MSKVFGILTAIALVLSALIASKNKEQFEARTAETAAEKDLLTKAQARLKAAQEVLAALPIERAAVDADSDQLTSTEAALQKTNAGIETEKEAVTAKIAANEEKLNGIREKTSKVNLKELASEMRLIKAELEELSVVIQGNEARRANLTAQDTSTTAQISDVKSKFDSFSNSQSLPSLKTRIRSIYPNWGFVTLASGNNAGVVANSTLNVVREGETIAKLLVTAVETGSSSASIVPDSLAPDVTLMVGDQVIHGQAAAKTTSN
jgi:hypothetical protein